MYLESLPHNVYLKKEIVVIELSSLFIWWIVISLQQLFRLMSIKVWFEHMIAFQDKSVGMTIEIQEVVWTIYVSLMIQIMGSTSHITMTRYMVVNIVLIHQSSHRDGQKVWPPRKYHVLYVTNNEGQLSWWYQVYELVNIITHEMMCN